MKKTTQILLASLFVFVLSLSPAYAAKKKAPQAEPAATTVAATPEASHGEGFEFGLGYSTFGAGTSAVGFLTGLGGSVSTMMQFNDHHSLQILFGISTTSPFIFSAGPVYRWTLKGDRKTGFHIGGGAVFSTIGVAGGAATQFQVNMAPLAGAHFTLPGAENIRFSIDGGPQFQLTGGTFTFGFGSFSSLLGLNVHYMF